MISSQRTAGFFLCNSNMKIKETTPLREGSCTDSWQDAMVRSQCGWGGFCDALGSFLLTTLIRVGT